jgi:hypothetical protein
MLSVFPSLCLGFGRPMIEHAESKCAPGPHTRQNFTSAFGFLLGRLLFKLHIRHLN